MWNNVIGIENEQGTNSAIEATLRAPSYGGGYKAQRMERAQQLVEACESCKRSLVPHLTYRDLVAPAASAGSES